MKYSFLLLIVCVFFFQCKEWEKKKIQPPVETFSLEKLFGEVRIIDTSAKMLQFKPDTGFFKFNQSIQGEFYPDPVYGLKGNVASLVITELSPGNRGRIEEDYTIEYQFENGRPVKMNENKPGDTTIQTLQYNAAGILIENKSIYPNENDSVTLEYQYDNQKRLTKILYFDFLNVLMQTSYFFYNKHGNLDSMFYDNSEGESYSYKYFTNNASNSYLKVKIDETGKIISANFYTLEDHDLYSNNEYYDKEERAFISLSTYQYNTFGDITKVETVDSRQNTVVNLTQSYPNRDSAGSWIEMKSYVNRDLYSITRRAITYKKPAP